MLLHNKINKSDIKAVIFDFDNTLVDENYWIISRWKKTNRYVEKKYNIEKYSEIFWKVFYEKGKSNPKLVDETLLLIGMDSSIVGEIVNYFKNVIVDEKLIIGVIECLDQLKKKYIVGLITNGKKETHEDRINRANLTSYFDIILYSYDNPKPSKDPFIRCAKKLNIKPKNIIYIGNDYYNDYIPALKVGYHPILFDPDRNNGSGTNCNIINEMASLIKILS